MVHQLCFMLIFPSYSANPEDVEYEDFCRNKIALHHPYRQYPTLDSVSHETWAAAYADCKATCTPHDFDYMDDIQNIDDVEVPEEDFEEPSQHQVPYGAGDGHELLAGQTARRNPAERNEDPDNLGDRVLDWQYDWQPHCGTYMDHPHLFDESDGGWWARAKDASGHRQAVAYQSADVVSKFAPAQKLVYDLVMSKEGMLGMKEESIP